LLSLIDDEACGSLQVRDETTPVTLFLFGGEVLGASASDDDDRLVRRLLAARHLQDSQIPHLRKLAGDDPIALILWEVLPEALTQQLVGDRFRENLARFLTCNGSSDFEARDSLLGVPQLTLGHDTRALVGDLEVLIGRSAALRTVTGMSTLLQQGRPKPTDVRERKLWSLLTDDSTVGTIVARSPYEELATLDLLVGMMDTGAVHTQAVPAGDLEEDEDDLLADFSRATRAPDSMIEIEDDDEETGQVPRDLIDELEKTASGFTPPEPEAEKEPEVEDDPPSEPPAVDGFDVAGFSAGPDEHVYAEELAMFADHDEFRGAGKEGHFSKTQEELHADRIDLGGAPEVVPVPQAEPPTGNVKMNFGGPALNNEDAVRKIKVANDVLRALSTAFDEQQSKGAGPAQVQLLLDGAPSEFAALFQQVAAHSDGEAPAAAIISNLRRRPASEHRRLLNRGISNLIERAMNLGADSLDDDHVDAFLEGCVGYQSRLGI
jgi:hypothetical protein